MDIPGSQQELEESEALVIREVRSALQKEPLPDQQIEQLFDKVERTGLVISAQGRHEDFLLFTNLHISLLLK
jgi:hypothetical protein